MRPITDQVSGEDQIWVVETGHRSLVHVWEQEDEVGRHERSTMVACKRLRKNRGRD